MEGLYDATTLCARLHHIITERGNETRGVSVARKQGEPMMASRDVVLAPLHTRGLSVLDHTRLHVYISRRMLPGMFVCVSMGIRI